MNYNWILNRLKLMSIREIVSKVKINIDNKVLHFTKDCEYILNTSVRYLPYNNNIELADFEKDKILENADRILLGEYLIFNKKIDLNKKEKFFYDPINRVNWDRVIFDKINFNSDINDAKVIMEINKQQYLTEVGFAYLINKDERYAKFILNSIRDWINECGNYIGPGWKSGLEIGLRCISWMYSISFIKDYIDGEQEDINYIIQSIYKQFKFVERRPSLYSSANNHLIGELSFRLFSVYFINDKNSKNDIKNLRLLLDKYVLDQFYSDGVNKEQSINYQVHTTELYLLCQNLLESVEESFNENTLSILGKSLNFINNVTFNDGETFNIGDDDGGSIIKLIKNQNNELELLSLGSYMLQKKFIKITKCKSYYKTNALYYKEHPANLKVIDNKKIQYYPEGGYIIKEWTSCERKCKIIFDVGNSGMAPLNAHAHSDILSINLYVDNKPLLIDNGTYKYHMSKGLRNYLRSSESHNTISLKGFNYIEQLGNFMCKQNYNIENVLVGDDKISCEISLGKKLNVIREIVFKNENLIIRDSILNVSKNTINLSRYFNFDSRLEVNKLLEGVEVIGENIKIYSDNNSSINLNQRYQSKKYYQLENNLCCEFINSVKPNTKKELNTIINFGG